MKNTLKKSLKAIVSLILALVIAAGVAYASPAENADARTTCFTCGYLVKNSANNKWFWQNSSITVRNTTNSTIYISVQDMNSYRYKVASKALKPGKSYTYTFRSGTYKILAMSSRWSGRAKLTLSSTNRTWIMARYTGYSF